jgi:hypothetical protein
MKKTRLIALTLVVALMLMGAGYAFWQESMTINAAVETGELDFAFRKASFSGGEYVKGSAKVDKEDDNILHLEFKNMHPSAYATVGFRMVNTGTIGLKVEDFVFEGDDSNLAQLLVSEVNGAKVRNRQEKDKRKDFRHPKPIGRIGKGKRNQKKEKNEGPGPCCIDCRLHQCRKINIIKCIDGQ